jgi:hypothetical protein
MDLDQPDRAINLVHLLHHRTQMVARTDVNLPDGHVECQSPLLWTRSEMCVGSAIVVRGRLVRSHRNGADERDARKERRETDVRKRRVAVVLAVNARSRKVLISLISLM